ncbi:MAG: GWxTD domain-containing protein [Ignavibacteria bacterium]|nr:GWxTD domain-containing protein [Ignavibacteria bacterium]
MSRLLCGTACLLLISVSRISAQVEASEDHSGRDAIPFNVDHINFAGPTPDQGRLDVFIQVPYGVLGFFREGENYFASYEVSIDLLDANEKHYQGKDWTEEITATFEETASSGSYSLVRQVFDVDPGRYTIVAMVRDLEIREPMRVSEPVTVRAYPDRGFFLSGIMLINQLSVNEGKKTIIPNVSSNVGHLTNGFFGFLEAYNGDSLARISTVTEIVNAKEKVILSSTADHKLNPGRNQVFVTVDNSQMTMGEYVLRVRAIGVNGEELAASEKPFIIRWKGMPVGMKDLDNAIQQLAYIENPGEIDHIQEADDENERRNRFLEFWKRRDPTPATARNEKMEEYYSRVHYANKNFAHYIDGWRTDMGMVYIIYGAPNNVERHPFDIDSKPYEIWSYYDLNHQFEFVDETGFGDYRLTSPIWEVWQRPK